MTHDFSIEAISRFTSKNYAYRGIQCDKTECESEIKIQEQNQKDFSQMPKQSPWYKVQALAYSI